MSSLFLKWGFSAELAIVLSDELREDIEPAGFHIHTHRSFRGVVVAGAWVPQWSLPGFHNPERTEEPRKGGQADTRMFAIPGVTITQCLQVSVEQPNYCLLNCSENKQEQNPFCLPGEKSHCGGLRAEANCLHLITLILPSTVSPPSSTYLHFSG